MFNQVMQVVSGNFRSVRSLASCLGMWVIICLVLTYHAEIWSQWNLWMKSWDTEIKIHIYLMTYSNEQERNIYDILTQEVNFYFSWDDDEPVQIQFKADQIVNQLRPIPSQFKFTVGKFRSIFSPFWPVRICSDPFCVSSSSFWPSSDLFLIL